MQQVGSLAIGYSQVKKISIETFGLFKNNNNKKN